MSAQPVDYDALAQKYGSVSSPDNAEVDYDALAKQFGSQQQAKPDVDSAKLPPEVQRAVAAVPRPAPPVGLTPGNRYVAAPNQETPEVRLGNMVPQGAVPALTAAQKYAVDPFEKMAKAGSEAGRNLGEDVVTGATMLSHPAYLSATLPSPYGPKPPVRSPEQMAAEEHPIALGAARAIGSVAGGTVADPRNWPFFASAAARPILQRVISGGFGAQMGMGAVDAAKNLYQNWDTLSPSQRAELATQGGLTAAMAAGSVSHALSPAPAVEAQPTRAELAEHLDRTNFHSPEALRASWTAEKLAQAPAPLESQVDRAVAEPTPVPIDYDALAKRHGALSPAQQAETIPKVGLEPAGALAEGKSTGHIANLRSCSSCASRTHASYPRDRAAPESRGPAGGLRCSGQPARSRLVGPADRQSRRGCTFGECGQNTVFRNNGETARYN